MISSQHGDIISAGLCVRLNSHWSVSVQSSWKCIHYLPSGSAPSPSQLHLGLSLRGLRLLFVPAEWRRKLMNLMNLIMNHQNLPQHVHQFSQLHLLHQGPGRISSIGSCNRGFCMVMLLGLSLRGLRLLFVLVEWRRKLMNYQNLPQHDH